MSDASDNLSFMNGIPELLILQLLSQHEMYGYEIVRAIAQHTDQVITVGEGCVYPLLHAMVKKKWLDTRRLQRDGRERIYYRLTQTGRDRLQQTAARWARLTDAVKVVLQGSPNAEKPL